MPVVNTVIPGQISKGDILGQNTDYHLYSGPGRTFSCISSIVSSQTDQELVHNNKFSNTLAEVDTPVYKGLALRDEQVENNWEHEGWWFAPGIGLVKIDTT